MVGSETEKRVVFVEPGQWFLHPSTFEDVQSNISDSFVYWWIGYAFNQTLWEAWSYFLTLAGRSPFSIRWKDGEVFNIHPCFGIVPGGVTLENRRDRKKKCSEAFKKAFLSSPAFLVSSSLLVGYYKRKLARRGEEGGGQSRDLIPGGATPGILWFWTLGILT